MEAVTADVERAHSNGSTFFPIERPQLMARLARAASFDIATIVAPAGYGKSTALRQYLASVDRGIIIRASPDTRSLDRFVSAFTEAIDVVPPGTAMIVHDAVASCRGDTNALASWAISQLRTRTSIIAIDDLHHLDGNEDIRAFLTALLDDESLRGRVRWILCSRTTPRLPLASWIAYGRCDIGLGVDVLRFTYEEYASAASRLAPDAEQHQLLSLYQVLAGWPAALIFALRVASTTAVPRRLTEDTRNLVYAYLAEQVWSSLSDRSRDFLISTIFLPYITPASAVASGFPEYAEIIEYLLGRVAFITEDDSDRYHIHDLFHDFLVTQQLRKGITKPELLRRAGDTLERSGDLVGAFNRYAAAGDREAIFAAISRHGLSILERRLASQLTDALDLVNDRDSPELAVLRAERMEYDGDLNKAVLLYVDALAKATSIPLRTHIAARAARAIGQATSFGAFEGAVIISSLLSLYESAEDGDADRRGLFGSILAQTLAQTGRLDEVVDRIIASIPLESMSPLARHAALMRVGTVRFYSGHHDRAIDIAAVSSKFAAANGEHWITLHCESLSLSSNMALGEYTTALTHLAALEKIANLTGDRFYQAYGWSAGMQANCLAGYFDTARSKRFCEPSHNTHSRLVAYSSALFDAYEAIVSLRFNDAYDVLRSLPLDRVTEASRLCLLGLRILSAALVHDVAEAETSICHFDNVARDFPAATYPTDFLLGYRYVAMGHLLIANSAGARQCVAKSPPWRTLTWLSEIDDALLAAARASRNPLAPLDGLRAGGRAGIAALFETALKQHYERHRAKPLLTEGELRILRHLEAYRSNPEIATAECLTVNTVKTHVSSILRKLGATRRAEAVARARSLALL